MARHFAGRVRYYEIWNEWNHNGEPTKSPENYLNLVKAATQAIKIADPEAKVLAGAVTTKGIRGGWVNQLVALGIMRYVDGVSIHPYIHCERDARPEAWANFIAEARNGLQMANGGREVPLYLTEVGWPSHKGVCGSSPETVAEYLAQALLLVRTVPSVRGIWWYDLKDDGPNRQEREYNFGLIDYHYDPKPAFESFSDVASLVRSGRRFVRLPAPDGVTLVEIVGTSGEKDYALWTNRSVNVQVSVTLNRKSGSKLTFLDVGTGRLCPMRIPKGRFETNLLINGSPRIIFGANSISIKSLIWKTQ